MDLIGHVHSNWHLYSCLKNTQFTLDNIIHISKQVPRRLIKKSLVSNLNSSCIKKRSDDFKNLGINDPLFSTQWHLHNSKTPGNDINVLPVWKRGITGENVTVCFVDDGLDFDHPDLKDNFYAAGSHDFNDHVDLPKPRLKDDRHGTRCAGEVAGIRNDVCGVGIAWSSKVSGVRILSGDLTEADEALSINYDFHNNHIYSCSWGPSDNGMAVEAPPKIVKDAFLNGVRNGRNGLGSLYVFASGNGGRKNDNCNFDGYTNMIFTITIGAIDQYNLHPEYSEECAMILAVTYGSGSGEYIVFYFNIAHY